MISKSLCSRIQADPPILHDSFSKINIFRCPPIRIILSGTSSSIVQIGTMENYKINPRPSSIEQLGHTSLSWAGIDASGHMVEQERPSLCEPLFVGHVQKVASRSMKSRIARICRCSFVRRGTVKEIMSSIKRRSLSRVSGIELQQPFDRLITSGKQSA